MMSFTLLYFGLFLPDPIFLCAIIPIKTYSNAKDDKAQILSENKGKSGIYMWTNSINDKKYIGSAVDLSNRFSSYYLTTYMEDALKRGISHIYRALLKNGHENFSLTILEYCEPYKCLIREKHYWDLLKPEYNIAKEPGAPFSGRTHSDKTKKKYCRRLIQERKILCLDKIIAMKLVIKFHFLCQIVYK